MTHDRDVGELRLAQYDGFDRRLVIEHADPLIWVPDEWVSTGRWCVDNVFTVRGSNRTVVYRLLEYDFPSNRWLAQWPD